MAIFFCQIKKKSSTAHAVSRFGGSLRSIQMREEEEKKDIWNFRRFYFQLSGMREEDEGYCYCFGSDSRFNQRTLASSGSYFFFFSPRIWNLKIKDQVGI